jgi:hypothetical protein
VVSEAWREEGQNVLDIGMVALAGLTAKHWPMVQPTEAILIDSYGLNPGLPTRAASVLRLVARFNMVTDPVRTTFFSIQTVLSGPQEPFRKNSAGFCYEVGCLPALVAVYHLETTSDQIEIVKKLTRTSWKRYCKKARNWFCAGFRFRAAPVLPRAGAGK